MVVLAGLTWVLSVLGHLYEMPEVIVDGFFALMSLVPDYIGYAAPRMLQRAFSHLRGVPLDVEQMRENNTIPGDVSPPSLFPVWGMLIPLFCMLRRPA